MFFEKVLWPFEVNYHPIYVELQNHQEDYLKKCLMLFFEILMFTYFHFSKIPFLEMADVAWKIVPAQSINAALQLLIHLLPNIIHIIL